VRVRTRRQSDATGRHLDRHAAFSRTGRGGVLQVDTDGLLAASTPTARRGRSTHSSTRTCWWRTRSAAVTEVAALDGASCSRGRPAATVYRAALRAELTSRLGVEWDPVDELGQADIAGISKGCWRAFSTRSRELAGGGRRELPTRI